MSEQEEGYFTEEEQKKYQESIEKMFVPIGVNIFELIEQNDDLSHKTSTCIQNPVRDTIQP